jgi:protease-4
MVDESDPARTTTVLYVVVVVVAVLIGTVLAPSVWGFVSQTQESENPDVAVITLRGPTNSQNAQAITKDLREARRNASVEAVVLRIDSNGGPVSPSEELYLAVNETAQQMPVVAYVEGSAASGGYYTVAPSDEIVVKPSSSVGSIGVVVQAYLGLIEQVGKVSETYVRSGPDKAQISKDGLREDLETLHNAFTNAVMRHRGEKLASGPVQLNREDVMAGKTYLGSTAVQNGFADQIGDLDTAISRAAERSSAIDGTNYDVAYRDEPNTGIGFLFGKADVERVDGNIVYVDASEDAETEFEQPVRFYAVWGVPADADAEEVSRNESG